MSEKKEFDHSEDHAGIGLPSLPLARTRTISLSLSLWDYQETDEERTTRKKAKIQDKIIARKDRVQECDYNNSNDHHDLNDVGIGLPSAVPAKKRPLSLSLSLWDYEATNEARPALKVIKIKENTIKREDQVQEYDRDYEDRNSGTSVLVPANSWRPLSLSLSLWDYHATEEETIKSEDQVEECDENNCINDDEDRNNGYGTGSEVVAMPMNMPQLELAMNVSPQQMMLPWDLMKSKIEKMGGRAIKMVIQKQLFKSDVNSTNNRFSIPESQIEEQFLTEEEVELLERREANNRAVGMRVMVIDPELEEHNDVILKKWEMKVSSVYNLTRQWNAIVQNNNLKVDDTVQLWSFRSPTHKLCFALLKVT